MSHNANTLNYTITFHSDWHIGSGTGISGKVDRAVKRDDANLPYVPAKTIRGLLRDSAETAAVALDNGTQGAWSRWVDYLFGGQPALRTSPAPRTDTHLQPSAISVGPARYSAAIRNVAAHKVALTQGATVLRPGVKIDHATGTAQDDHLRFIEVARAQTTLHGHISSTDALPETAVALLSIAAHLCTRIGGKRRRGLGECSITIGSDDEHAERLAAAIAFAGAGDPPAPPTTSRLTQTALAAAAMPSDLDHTIAVSVVCDGPVLIARELLGNVVHGSAYIPGAALLPLLDRVWGAPFRSALVSGHVSVGNAYPAHGDHAMVPAPRILGLAKKTTDGRAKPMWKSPATASQSDEIGTSDELLKPLREAFVAEVAEGLVRIGMADVLSIDTHNVVEDTFQRPTSDVGGVYSFEALAPGTKLVAEIRISEELRTELASALGPDFATALNGSHRIGTSRKDDYGRIQLEAFEREPTDEWPAVASTNGTDHEILVWLESDAMILDERLRPDPTPAGLLREFTTTLGPVTIADGGVFMATARHDSWNSRWQMPRPSITTIAAGSCIVIAGVDPTNANTLQRLVRNGIGHRKGEGFGRIRIKPISWLREFNIGISTAGGSAAPGQWTTNDRDAKLLGRFADAAMMTAFERVLAERLAKADGARGLLDLKGKPSKSQLGTLRALAAGYAGQRSGAAAIENWIDGVSQIEKQHKAWGDLAGLRDLVANPNRVWKHVGLEPGEYYPTQPPEELARQAVGQLLTTAIATLQRRDDQKGDS